MGILSGSTGGYVGSLVQSIVALAGVCALAVVVLRMLAARGLGRAPRGRILSVVERMPLDARSAVCVVNVGDRTFLLGVADGSAPRLLAELDAAPVADASPESTPARTFRDVLAELPGVRPKR